MNQLNSSPDTILVMHPATYERITEVLNMWVKKERVVEDHYIDLIVDKTGDNKVVITMRKEGEWYKVDESFELEETYEFKSESLQSAKRRSLERIKGKCNHLIKIINLELENLNNEQHPQ